MIHKFSLYIFFFFMENKKLTLASCCDSRAQRHIQETVCFESISVREWMREDPYISRLASASSLQGSTINKRPCLVYLDLERARGMDIRDYLCVRGITYVWEGDVSFARNVKSLNSNLNSDKKWEDGQLIVTVAVKHFFYIWVTMRSRLSSIVGILFSSTQITCRKNVHIFCLKKWLISSNWEEGNCSFLPPPSHPICM